MRNKGEVLPFGAKDSNPNSIYIGKGGDMGGNT